ncbi:MAG TPA: 1,2-phenylacetyl-CoA epoxidase subunit PaaD [Candidatus Kapabacteria bacterium]|nr:1,2-phenylacetyl-CoA epoxidase subunit PaaD [Candidatus Kapabacteria bacterium]
MVAKQEHIFQALSHVMDPEIPTLSVIDLGMITDVITSNDGVTVKLLPTFVACPATSVIKSNIKETLEKAGIRNVEVLLEDSIAWSSDRVTEHGRKLLTDFGLGAPVQIDGVLDNVQVEAATCPHCGSANTTLKSFFGSTLCRSIHFCNDCHQGFERFKPL